MTYRQLQSWLTDLTPSQLDCDVTVYASEYDEYFPAADMMINELDDVLEANHPYITLA